MKNRISTAARRGIALAVEFSTLGEYGLRESSGVTPGPGRARLEDPPTGARRLQMAAEATPAPARPRANRLRPATAAARRLQPPAPTLRVAPKPAMRALALASERPERRPASRTRAGAAPPRPQPCLVVESGGSRAMRA